jgi:hypothetical protein
MQAFPDEPYTRRHDGRARLATRGQRRAGSRVLYTDRLVAPVPLEKSP